MQDPETYLNELGIELACAVYPSHPAVIDSTTRVTLGYETFFFSDAGAKNEFLGDIYSYCGVLTDPVTGDRFQPNESSSVFEYEDVKYILANESNASKFRAMPAMYYLPAHAMIPKDTTEVESE